MGEHIYDVCLSFAGEQREYVEAVHDALAANGVAVFYDNDDRASLWGKDLASEFSHIYATRARYCVIFLSAAYARRKWPAFELRMAQSRMFRDPGDYILPVRFDDTPVAEIPETLGFVDARVVPAPELANLVLTKLAHQPTRTTKRASIVVVTTDVPTFDPDRVIDIALGRSGMAVGADLRSRRTRSAIIAVPADEHADAEVLATLVPAIVAAGTPLLTAGTTLRVAITASELSVGDWDGVDVEATVDAAAAAEVGELMALAGTDSAVVVSKNVFESVVRKGRGGANPTAYREVPLAGGSTVHVRLPGFPRPPAPTPQAPNADRPTRTTTKNTMFFGEVKAGHIGDVYQGRDDG